MRMSWERLAAWILEEVHCADPDRLDRQRHIAMTGDDDDGQGGLHLLDALQKLNAVHVGHATVGDDAARLDLAQAVEEGLGRVIGAHVKVGAPKQELERLPHRLVVVDHMDHDFIRHIRPFLRPLLRKRGAV
jgi:hypothetical protein